MEDSHWVALFLRAFRGIKRRTPEECLQTRSVVQYKPSTKRVVFTNSKVFEFSYSVIYIIRSTVSTGTQGLRPSGLNYDR